MEKSKQSKVLILGDYSRSALAIIRSLGRRGIDVTVCTEHQRSIVKYSRYTAEAVILPSTYNNLDGWLASLKDLLRSKKFDLVIPAMDSTYIPLFLNRKDLGGFAKLVLPNEDSFQKSYFKDKTIIMARELGVPIPESAMINKKDGLITKDLTYPLVVKPVSSKVWVDGYKLEIGAKVARDFGELKNSVVPLLYFTPVLVQSYFAGVGIGQEFLCKEGEIILAFQHERIHEPEGSGGSSYRKSIPLDEKILDCSKKMLLHLRWNGPVMVEYKKNPKTGEFVLIEINGRFWGSLPLAIAAGVDFPYAAYQLFVNGEKVRPVKYRTGVYARNLVNDLRFLLKSRGIVVVLFNLGWAKLRFLTGREKWDAFTWDDPIPGIMEFLFAASSVFYSFVNWLSKIVSIAFYRQPQSGNIKKLLEKKRSILFVCLGNVSRSPFAAEYFKKKLAEKNISGVKVGSTGLYQKSGRQSTPYVKSAAIEYGVELALHRSSILSEEMVASSGLILCMDFYNYRDIKKKFPAAMTKLFLLGSFNGSCREIKDPQGGDPDTYRRSCRLIKDSIDKLISLKLMG